MSITSEYIQLAETISEKLSLPVVEGVYLPEKSNDEEYKDEFGFVFLQDDSVGPFYTSLPGELDALWSEVESYTFPCDVIELVRGMASDCEATRAIGLGAFNALSQYVLRESELDLWPDEKERGLTVGGVDIRQGEWIGMIGYFCPLIEKINEAGGRVLVLEKQPDRVLQSDECRLTQDPADLDECQHVLCTASSLVNNSLEVLLAHTPSVESFNLIGPSGSGLPDVLFKRGINTVGGILFDDIEALRESHEEKVSWRKAGRKYLLSDEKYPGFEKLVSVVLEKNKK